MRMNLEMLNVKSQLVHYTDYSIIIVSSEELRAVVTSLSRWLQARHRL